VDVRIAKGVELMNEPSAERLSVADYARLVGLSVSRFEHLFKKQIGRSPRVYLNAQTLEQARLLLCTTDLPIGEIRAMVGRRHIGHFNRLFKKAFEHSPEAYRKKQKRES